MLTFKVISDSENAFPVDCIFRFSVVCLPFSSYQDVFGRNEVADEPFSTESAIASDPRSSTFIETSNPNQLAPSTSTRRSRGSSRFSGISLSPLHSEQSFPDGQLGASSGSRGTDGRESISSADNQQSYDEDEDGHRYCI